MEQYTTNTYTMKREIINFSKKLSEGLSRPERKFYTDMTYGMLTSSSCLLTDIAQTLQEDILKINVVDRLSRHLAEGVPPRAMWNYLKTIRRWAPTEAVIHIDDSDVIKPEGNHFEALGVVRDGSKSTKEKSIYCKGYHVTEVCFFNKFRPSDELVFSTAFFGGKVVGAGFVVLLCFFTDYLCFFGVFPCLGSFVP